jgi:RNA polymerase sigma-70 factor (ECF subfamily)
LLQESLVGAYRGLARFNGKSSVKTWLTSILVRQAAKSWRKVKKYHGTLSIHGGGAAAERDRPIDDASLEVASGSEHVDRKIDLMQVLKTLPEEYRQALVLREFQGLSYEEIAQALGIPRGTVDSRIHRARQELRERLKSYGVESAEDFKRRRRDGVVEERQS